jgi:hypothetical protein
MVGGLKEEELCAATGGERKRQMADAKSQTNLSA